MANVPAVTNQEKKSMVGRGNQRLNGLEELQYPKERRSCQRRKWQISRNRYFHKVSRQDGLWRKVVVYIISST